MPIKIGSRNDPKTPECVLLGLIFVSFFPPIILPKIKPPTSVDEHIIKRNTKDIIFISLNGTR